jgi:hypothetical protein
MKSIQFIREISRPEYDLQAFVDLILVNSDARQACLVGMLREPHSMIYDHCFYAIAGASRAEPELFYAHWDEIAGLLDHANSYHRDYGLTILANLLPVDREDRFSAIFPAYLEHIRDAKFMTAACCIRNLKAVVKSRPDLTGPVLKDLIIIDYGNHFSPGQLALLKCGILELIEQVYPDLAGRRAVDAFILAALASPSPKTRRKAGEMARRFGLAVPFPGKA